MLLSIPTSRLLTATIIIIIKDVDSKGDHISKKGQVIINSTEHLPSTVQPRRPLVMFSYVHREGEILPFLPIMEKPQDREVKQDTRGSAMACHV